MTRKQFVEEVLEKRIKSMRDVLDKKNSEYADSEDVFKAFALSTSLSFHKTSQAVAWEFMVKHLQSIQSIISDYEKNNTLPDEAKLEEKIGDAINYLILIEGMFKEAMEPAKLEQARIKYTLI